MNPLMRKNILVVFSLLLFTSSFCSAQSVAQQEARLSGLEKQLQSQQTNLKTLKNELDDYPERVANAETEVHIAEVDSRTEKKELERLEGLNSEGQDLSREIKLQSHTVKMGERRIESETRSLERIRRYQENLEADIAKAETSVTQLEKQVSEQRRAIADARSAAEKAEATKAVVAVPAPPKIEITPAAPAPAPVPKKVETPKPVVAKAAPPSPDASTLSEEDQTTLISVREYLATLEAYKAESKAEFVRYDTLTLTGSKIRGKASFEHIVNNQYRAEARAQSGRQFIAVNKSQFMIDIPASGDGDEFVFYFDASDASRVQVVFFNKSLIPYL